MMLVDNNKSCRNCNRSVRNVIERLFTEIMVMDLDIAEMGMFTLRHCQREPAQCVMLFHIEKTP